MVYINIEMDLNLDTVRLLIISSACQNAHFLSKIARKDVKKVFYLYESCSLDDILSFVIAELEESKVDRVAFALHSDSDKMFLCEFENVVISSQSILHEKCLKEFFMCLSSTFMNTNRKDSSIDFLSCRLTDANEMTQIPIELKKIVSCPVNIYPDFLSTERKKETIVIKGKLENISIREMYFAPEKLEKLPKSPINGRIQNLSGYEKIRTVGKGAFGTAVLYRKKYDDSLVIVKEINMHDLTASERQLAINEVRVLSMLNHENIVSYYDSFEEDGVLMIEMEYADGGTLAQYLAQIKGLIDERELLLLFKQIVSAIKHMHVHNILHRDLKTANIFLTKEGTVKVGDFGISKMLTTKQGGAITVVGTPYYISPEMCEGKFYNQKSDIWALGCILYEMACQQKTFNGSNLPALVNKIVKGQFAPVKGNYSPGFKQLIRYLLQRDPDLRPTAADILNDKLPELLGTYENSIIKEYDDTEVSMDFDYHTQSFSAKGSAAELRSVLYEVKMHQADISLNPMSLPARSKIKEVALSSTHMLVLTSEQLVYSWGDGRKGQLGHGKLETWREKPFCIDALKGKNISRICAGEGFSLFLSNNGIVMTCGNGSLGCLGHGDWSMCIKPKIIEKLLSVDVSAVSCGPHHVVVIGSDGDAYAWGCGSGGRLGTGSEEDCCLPTEISLPSDSQPVKAYCGYDGTMFITDTGALYSCGRNDFNKLGLNDHKGFLMQFITKTIVEKQMIPVKLGWLRQKVISVSMGATHTAVLLAPGKLIMFGHNKNGQLGRGNLRSHSTPSVVKSMEDKIVTMVQCGDTFTIAGTAENVVYFWGSRQVLSPTAMKNKKLLGRSNQKNSKTNKSQKDNEDFISEVSEASFSEVIKIGASNSPLMTEIEKIGPDSPIIQVKTPNELPSGSPGSSMSSHGSTKEQYMEENRDHLVDSCTGRKDVILNPQEILALYASPAQIARGEIVSLANLYCFGMQVFLLVDTTAPLPRSQRKKEIPLNNYVPQIGDGKNFSKTKVKPQEMDSLGPIPEWLKQELADAVASSAMLNKTYTQIAQEKTNEYQTPLHQQKVLQTSKLTPKTNHGTPGCDKTSHVNRLQTSSEKSNFVKSDEESKNREIQLKNEIMQLREELKKYQEFSQQKNLRINDIEILDEDYLERPSSKKELKQKKESQIKHKHRSKICIVQ